jgi:hypothetical protein
MTDIELRQFAMLQLEMVLEYSQGMVLETDSRLSAALYCIQAMNCGPMPDDFDEVMREAIELDREVL